MSVQADVASAFAEVPPTVPVQYGARSTRGFLDRASALQAVVAGHQDAQVQVAATVLHIATDSLGPIAVDSVITVGQVGADSAAGGEAFTVNDMQLEDDGLITAIILSGGDR